MDTYGFRLKDFEILQELGHGSFGVVYKAKSVLNGEIYVIKKIQIDYLPQKNQKEVIHEAQILKKLDHPNIVKYFCSFTEGKTLCIVMEYIEGGDLHHFIKQSYEKKQYLPEFEVWRMTYELSSALNYLHNKKVIHRDIKPLNILITKDNRLKLADLGASKIVSTPMQATRVGTPLYLAPELVKHRPYDFKVDIWGLGCVVYSLAKLQPPFKADNLITLGLQIVSKAPEPIPVQYSVYLSDFILKLLSKQAVDRPCISSVLSMIPRNKEVLHSSSEVFSTQLTVERNSPVVSERKCTVCKVKPVKLACVCEELEPVPAEVKRNDTKEKIFKIEDRPETASKNRVIFRIGAKQRPMSASVRKNPLFHTRDLHSIAIPPNCVKLQSSPHRAHRRYITLNDLC